MENYKKQLWLILVTIWLLRPLHSSWIEFFYIPYLKLTVILLALCSEENSTQSPDTHNWGGLVKELMPFGFPSVPISPFSAFSQSWRNTQSNIRRRCFLGHQKMWTQVSVCYEAYNSQRTYVRFPGESSRVLKNTTSDVSSRSFRHPLVIGYFTLG